MKRTVKNYREIIISMINAMVRPVALNAWAYLNMEAAKRYYNCIVTDIESRIKVDTEKGVFEVCYYDNGAVAALRIEQAIYGGEEKQRPEDERRQYSGSTHGGGV